MSSLRSLAVLVLTVGASAIVAGCSTERTEAEVRSDIHSDEVVVFYPTFANRDETKDEWIVRIHGRIFEPEADSFTRARIVHSVRERVDVRENSPEAKRLDERLRHFLVDDERFKQIAVRLGGDVHTLDRSGANGHFAGTLRLPAAKVERLLAATKTSNGWLPFQAVTNDGDDRRFTGRVRFIEPEGVSIVSDIDDTLRISHIGDTKKVLEYAFLKKFEPVPGLAKLYAECDRKGAVFHYVSGSPWQLYEPLVTFFAAEGFPDGTFHLEYFRLTDRSLFHFLSSSHETKRKAIARLLETYPRRRFVFLGDSGEADPELYGEFARKHPQQVVGIFIRRVTDEEPTAKRYRDAFRDLPPDRWMLFRRSEEIADRLRALVAEGSRPH